MKWLEKNIGEYLYDIEIGKEFLNKIKGSGESPLQQRGGPEQMDSEPFPLKNVSLSRVLWQQGEFSEISWCTGKKVYFLLKKKRRARGARRRHEHFKQAKAKLAYGREDVLNLLG